MPERAHVASVDALDAFRANLVLYVNKARPALEEISAEVVRTRVWLEGEKRTYWEAELKRRKRIWDESQAALLSARISNFREETAAEVQAVHRAKRAYHEAEDKLRAVKRWNRDFDGSVQPLVKQMEKLQTLIYGDLPKAIAHLSEIMRTLEAYAEVSIPAAPIVATEVTRRNPSTAETVSPPGDSKPLGT